jgi:DNA (cytosine-5)-methyltransferase 1
MRVLDLFCGAGGTAMGLHRAWPDAHIVGVDIKSQPRYPFTFRQRDAMTVTQEELRSFDFVWASPPCQSYSLALRHLATPQPKLIDALREMLIGAWVIENVVGAPLRNPLMLCGTMFGMRVYRHRLFEASFPLHNGMHCDHRRHALNPHSAEGRARIYAEFGRQEPEKLWGREIGVPWMNRHETREAIPPAYSEYIARQYVRA